MKNLFIALALLIITIPISSAFLYGFYYLGVVHILETMNVYIPNFTYAHCLTASILIAYFIDFIKNDNKFTDIVEVISYRVGKIFVNLLVLLILYLIWIF